jgi:hypothetical protein
MIDDYNIDPNDNFNDNREIEKEWMADNGVLLGTKWAKPKCLLYALNDLSVPDFTLFRLDVLLLGQSRELTANHDP